MKENNDFIQGGNIVDTKAKTNGKMTFAIIMLVIMLALLGAVTYFYYFKKESSRELFLKNVSSFLNSNINIEESNEVLNLLENGGTINLKPNIKIDIDNNNLFNISGNIKLIDDTKNQYMEGNITNNNQEIVDFKTLNQDNKLYVMLNNIFDTYHYTDIDTKEVNTEGIKKVKENVLNTLKNYFTEDKFLKEKTKVTVDNVSYDANKITLTLTEKDFGLLVKTILENLKNDEEVIKSITTDSNNFKEQLEEKIDDIDLEELSNETFISYSIYLNKNELLEQIITLNEYTITITGKSSGNITLKSNNTTILEGNYRKDYLKVNYKDENNNNITLTYKTNTISSKKEKDTIIITGTINNTNINLEIELDAEVDAQKTIPNIDLTNAKPFEELTEDETNRFYSKIMEIYPMKAIDSVN